MAITWRNVDVPQGLNQAASQVQQSYTNVASSLRNAVQGVVDMKSNDAMAALEARLAQEQQLGNVDQMAAMDAGQLRGATSGWIDTKQARQQILGRQGELVQGVENQFNEALAMNDMGRAAQLKQQLAGRDGYDASGLANQYNQQQQDMAVADVRQRLASGDFDGAVQGIETLSQDPRFDSSGLTRDLNNAQFTDKMLSGDLEGAQQFVTTTEQQDQLLRQVGRAAAQSFGQKGSQFVQAINNPDLSVEEVSQKIRTFDTEAMASILELPAEQQAAMIQQLGMIQKIAQNTLNERTAIPPRVEREYERALELVDQNLTREADELRFTSEESLRTLQARRDQIVGDIGLESLTEKGTAENLPKLYKALEEAGVPKKAFRPILENIKNIDQYNLGTIASAALTMNMSNRFWFDNWFLDGRKNTFKDRLDLFQNSGEQTIADIVQNRSFLNIVNMEEAYARHAIENRMYDTKLSFAGRNDITSNELFEAFNPRKLVGEAISSMDTSRLRSNSDTSGGEEGTTDPDVPAPATDEEANNGQQQARWESFNPVSGETDGASPRNPIQALVASNSELGQKINSLISEGIESYRQMEPAERSLLISQISQETGRNTVWVRNNLAQIINGSRLSRFREADKAATQRHLDRTRSPSEIRELQRRYIEANQ